jgi:hypothetical protein
LHSTLPNTSIIERLVMKRCLDDNQIAQYADFLAGHDVPELSQEIIDHGADCFECKRMILAVVELMST